MNTRGPGADRMHEDLSGAVDALARYGIKMILHGVENLRNGDSFRPDCSVTIELEDRHPWVMPLEYKSQLRPSTVGLLRELRPGALVVSHHITRAVGELLRERGLNYVDAAGNASLRYAGVVVEIERRASSLDSQARPATTSLFTPAAMPVVLSLLNNPDLLFAPLREIQARSHVSLGTVQKVVEALRRDGLKDLREGGPQQRARWRRLLDGWVSAYLAGTRDKLSIGRFNTDRQLPHFMELLPSLPAAVSGEAAAALLGYSIRPGTVDLYVKDNPGPLVQKARLRADPDGWIFVRRASWTSRAEFDTRRPTADNVAPAPVLYADLIAHGDSRLDDISRELERRDPYLRPFFE